MSRHNSPLQRAELAELPGHARFQLDLDWALIGDDDGDEDLDISTLRWQASPWSIYQSVAANDRVSDEAIRLVAELYFEMGKPTGGTFLTSLGDLAATQQMSALKAAEALAALDSAGWLTWDGQRQQAKLEAAPRGNPRPENEPDRRSTSKPAEMPAAYRREVSS